MTLPDRLARAERLIEELRHILMEHEGCCGPAVLGALKGASGLALSVQVELGKIGESLNGEPMDNSH